MSINGQIMDGRLTDPPSPSSCWSGVVWSSSLSSSHSQAIHGVGVTESNADGCTTEILPTSTAYELGRPTRLSIRSDAIFWSGQSGRTSTSKKTGMRGVKANTRSNTKIKTVDERVRRAVALYLAAWRMTSAGYPAHTLAMRLDSGEQWARTRARALHRAEELDLLEEETRRVVQFLSWRASWWENRLLLKQSESPTASGGDSGEAAREEADVQREGEVAYARRQSQLQRDLRDAFKRQWEPLPAYIAEARERVKLLTPDEEADVATAGNVGDIGNDDADAPVPPGAPGAVVTTEVDEPL
ncbi:hypothetical protein C8F01DRAFT_1320334 [Mycena amicta]|nr:hypothetical protein C8F01DRAFT_1320334 [Mycena amicta]